MATQRKYHVTTPYMTFSCRVRGSHHQDLEGAAYAQLLAYETPGCGVDGVSGWELVSLESSKADDGPDYVADAIFQFFELS